MSEKRTCHEWEPDGEYWRVGPNGERICLKPEGYCPTCGTRLNADGTVTPMVPKVTSEAALLNDVEWRAVTGAFADYAEECHVNPSAILDALKRYRQIGDAAISSWQDTRSDMVPRAALEWLAGMLANTPGCPTSTEHDACDRSGLNAIDSYAKCKACWLRAALAATGAGVSDDTRMDNPTFPLSEVRRAMLKLADVANRRMGAHHPQLIAVCEEDINSVLDLQKGGGS